MLCSGFFKKSELGYSFGIDLKEIAEWEKSAPTNDRLL